MIEANKRGTPKLRLAVSWETDGGLFYKLSFLVVPIARLEVIPIFPSPSALAPMELIPDSLYILCRRSCHRSPSPAQVERAGEFYKHILTTVCLFFTSVAISQSSELTASKTWTGHTCPHPPHQVPIKRL